MGGHRWVKKRPKHPLFLGRTLLSGSLGWRRSSGLGDSAGLGLAENLGLLNNCGSLDKLS